MNYSFDEALKMVGDFLEANEANYTVKCAWEVVSSNHRYTQEELDGAYDSGYNAGNEREYNLGHEDGYEEGYEDGYNDVHGRYSE